MTRDEAEALLTRVSPDDWSDVRTWQSPAGTWTAWIAAGSTATEPTKAYVDACGVEGYATESDALRALVERLAREREADAVEERAEVRRLRALARKRTKLADACKREAAQLREALLMRVKPDRWSDVRTWRSHSGLWSAWIAAGSTATEPTRAHIDGCGVEGYVTEADAVRALVERSADLFEKSAATERSEAKELRELANRHGEIATIYDNAAKQLREALRPCGKKLEYRVVTSSTEVHRVTVVWSDEKEAWTDPECHGFSETPTLVVMNEALRRGLLVREIVPPGKLTRDEAFEAERSRHTSVVDERRCAAKGQTTASLGDNEKA